MNLTDFKNWLIINKDTKNTVATYMQQLKLFFKSYSEFNQENVNAYLLDRLDKKISKNTWNLDVNAFRCYAEFLKIEITFPKTKTPDQKLQPYLEEKDFKEILLKLKWILQQEDKYRAILEVLFYAGLRVKELKDLKREDFNFEKNTIIVRNTKGKVDRIVPFPASTSRAVQNYFLRNREMENAFDTSIEAIRQSLSKIGKEMGYSFNLHPHTFRHSAAHYLLKITSNDYRTVQNILGHANIKTTMLYTKITNEEAINKVQKIYRRKK